MIPCSSRCRRPRCSASRRCRPEPRKIKRSITSSDPAPSAQHASFSSFCLCFSPAVHQFTATMSSGLTAQSSLPPSKRPKEEEVPIPPSLRSATGLVQYVRCVATFVSPLHCRRGIPQTHCFLPLLCSYKALHGMGVGLVLCASIFASLSPTHLPFFRTSPSPHECIRIYLVCIAMYPVLRLGAVFVPGIGLGTMPLGVLYPDPSKVSPSIVTPSPPPSFLAHQLYYLPILLVPILRRAPLSVLRQSIHRVVSLCLPAYPQP